MKQIKQFFIDRNPTVMAGIVYLQSNYQSELLKILKDSSRFKIEQVDKVSGLICGVNNGYMKFVIIISDGENNTQFLLSKKLSIKENICLLRNKYLI